MSWATYVSQKATGLTHAELAEKANVSASVVSRWRSGEVTPKPENVVVLARNMGWRPVDALVGLELITAKEARQRAVAQPSWDGIPDEELVRLIAARLTRAKELMDDARPAANTEADVTTGDVGAQAGDLIQQYADDQTTESVEGQGTA